MRFITLAKAAEEIGVSVKSVVRWTQRKDRPLKTAFLGDRRVTSQEWLEEFAKPVESETDHDDELARQRCKRFAAQWGVNQPARSG